MLLKMYIIHGLYGIGIWLWWLKGNYYPTIALSAASFSIWRSCTVLSTNSFLSIVQWMIDLVHLKDWKLVAWIRKLAFLTNEEIVVKKTIVVVSWLALSCMHISRYRSTKSQVFYTSHSTPFSNSTSSQRQINLLIAIFWIWLIVNQSSSTKIQIYDN